MKKMLLATALALLYYRMCSTDVYCSKQTGYDAAGNHHPSFLRFWNWAEENVMQPKFVAAQKMLLKQKPNHVQMDCSVLLL